MMCSKPRAEKQEGSIGNSFASLAGEKETLLPARYLDLKRELIGDEANQAALIAAWARLTSRLAELLAEIEERQQHTTPEATYDELVENPSPELINRIRECGSVVIHGTVSKDQALKWLDDVRDYIKLNPQVKGFPKDDKQVYEIYWSRAQQEARSHPRMLKTQAALLSIFTAPSESDISLSTPLVYSDRLRVYEKILAGKWEEFDAWEMDKRADAVQDLYPGPGSCRSADASFVQAEEAQVRLPGRKGFFSPDNWELDFETTNFPGSPHHRSQELNDVTHPHLELLRTMNAAAVFYIPAVALTPKNAHYTRDQRATFLSGKPAPDSPGGIGESEFKGRGTRDDLLTMEGKEGMGLVPFRLNGHMSETERSVRQAANAILGF
ncbi:hypothetical protein MRS44_009624 [Fusarium solani]|uniref:uncharacterized protein n=1 Tax=Fusarium solani TaxID=169388 RepID=UPI0032C43B08|nr:hypothetical protein MRS44_009624 [Fusarium solani]